MKRKGFIKIFGEELKDTQSLRKIIKGIILKIVPFIKEHFLK